MRHDRSQIPISEEIDSDSGVNACVLVQWQPFNQERKPISRPRSPVKAPNALSIDVDVAVAVESWAAFNEPKNLLTNSGNFAAGRNAHRVVGTSDELVGRQLDIMPFGRGIEEPRAVIRWPSDVTTVMSVAGFAEALAASIEHRVDDQRIRLASVPGLAILKLVAWSDRGTTTDKDTVDFSRLLTTYEHVIGPDDLYVAYLDALEANDIEPDATAAWLLGAHIRAIASVTTLADVIGVLDNAAFRQAMLNAENRTARHETLVAKCHSSLAGAPPDRSV